MHNKAIYPILIVFLVISLASVSIVDAGSWDSPIKLTKSTATDRDSCISDDGSKIAFARDDGEDWEVFVVNSDGTGLTQLTDNTVDDMDPSISADGSKVAF